MEPACLVVLINIAGYERQGLRLIFNSGYDYDFFSALCDFSSNL